MVIEYSCDNPIHPLFDDVRGINRLAQFPVGVERCSSGPLFTAEDVWYPGRSVVCYGRGSAFDRDLTATLGAQNARFSDLAASSWNRDPMCRTAWGVSFLLPGELPHTYLAPNFKNYELSSPQTKSRLLKIHSELMFWGIAEGYQNNLARVFFSPPAFSARSVGFHTFPIAGGNILAGRKLLSLPNHQENAPTFIVGKNTVLDLSLLLDDVSLQAARMMDPHFEQGLERDYIRHFISIAGEPPANPFDALHYVRRYQAAKVIIRHWLYGSRGRSPHTRRRHLYPILDDASIMTEDWMAQKPVIFVDQWAYHIDLQMVYIGLGVVLVHDFRAMDQLLCELLTPNSPLKLEFQKFLEQHDKENSSFTLNYPILLKHQEDFYLNSWSCFQRANQKAFEKYQEIVDKVCATLEKNGFFPVRVGGLVCPNEHNPIELGTVQKTNSAKDLLAHNCMNLIPCNPGVLRQNGKLIARFDLLVAASPQIEPFYSVLWSEIERKVTEKLRNVGFDGAEIGLHKISSPHLETDVVNFTPFWDENETIPDDDYFGHTPTALMLKLLGGLRCQTTILSNEDVIALNPPPALPLGMRQTDIFNYEKCGIKCRRLFYIATNTASSPIHFLPNRVAETTQAIHVQSNTGFYTHPIFSTDSLNSPDGEFTTLHDGLELKYSFGIPKGDLEISETR